MSEFIVKGPKKGLLASAETDQLRAPMREESSKTAAAKRAAEIRGHIGEMDEGTDDFYVDKGGIPDGWTYEWKRHTVYGSEDPAYQVQLARAGWAPVPAMRHPEMMPIGSSHTLILRKGCILMERPTEIVEEVRDAELRRARMQVRAKEAQIAGAPDGTLTRDHASARPKINKSYSPIAIPE